jgi:hypothetical protein
VEFTRRSGITIQFQDDLGGRPVTTEVELCLYRVAQEGLRNLEKHSGAREGHLHERETPFNEWPLSCNERAWRRYVYTGPGTGCISSGAGYIQLVKRNRFVVENF